MLASQLLIVQIPVCSLPLETGDRNKEPNHSPLESAPPEHAEQGSKTPGPHVTRQRIFCGPRCIFGKIQIMEQESSFVFRI